MVYQPLETREGNVYRSGGNDVLEVCMQEISSMIIATPEAHVVIRKTG
ncbi:MAG: hypothetical protein N2561_04510 [Bacteroidetes bacterium]|nr:hypothetical protein [Bacteroidota bacterium]MCX7906782.1 hypothetical protein [Bacteroidota bacterium]MDW8136938.1 hypothetical protein [Bacteroidota bacterium]MDW8285191.1 hypothetical protein [Bacteroidota bacterium]